jgi:hypothetical protein
VRARWRPRDRPPSRRLDDRAGEVEHYLAPFEHRHRPAAEETKQAPHVIPPVISRRRCL